ncbi:MAG: hypothetical protein ACREFY_09480 [Acetobacteraceae bacterium]
MGGESARVTGCRASSMANGLVSAVSNGVASGEMAGRTAGMAGKTTGKEIAVGTGMTIGKTTGLPLVCGNRSRARLHDGDPASNVRRAQRGPWTHGHER